MIERVKARIAETFAPAIDFRAPYAKVMLDTAAKAVVAELREPAAPMLAALSDAIADGVSDERKWQRVIDAALTPPTNS